MAFGPQRGRERSYARQGKGFIRHLGRAVYHETTCTPTHTHMSKPRNLILQTRESPLRNTVFMTSLLPVLARHPGTLLYEWYLPLDIPESALVNMRSRTIRKVCKAGVIPMAQRRRLWSREGKQLPRGHTAWGRSEAQAWLPGSSLKPWPLPSQAVPRRPGVRQTPGRSFCITTYGFPSPG